LIRIALFSVNSCTKEQYKTPRYFCYHYMGLDTAKTNCKTNFFHF